MIEQTAHRRPARPLEDAISRFAPSGSLPHWTRQTTTKSRGNDLPTATAALEQACRRCTQPSATSSTARINQLKVRGLLD